VYRTQDSGAMNRNVRKRLVDQGRELVRAQERRLFQASAKPREMLVAQLRAPSRHELQRRDRAAFAVGPHGSADRALRDREPTRRRSPVEPVLVHAANDSFLEVLGNGRHAATRSHPILPRNALPSRPRGSRSSPLGRVFRAEFYGRRAARSWDRRASFDGRVSRILSRRVWWLASRA